MRKAMSSRCRRCSAHARATASGAVSGSVVGASGAGGRSMVWLLGWGVVPERTLSPLRV
jgi:hypothetical protein